MGYLRDIEVSVLKESAEIEKLKGQLSLAEERRKAKGERQQSKREVTLRDKIEKLRSGEKPTKNIWGK
jgi:hypothetical protein